MFQGAWDTGTYLRQLEKKEKQILITIRDGIT